MKPSSPFLSKLEFLDETGTCLVSKATDENATIRHSIEFSDPTITEEQVKTIYLRFIGHILIDELSPGRLRNLCQEMVADLRFEAEAAFGNIEPSQLAAGRECATGQAVQHFQRPPFYVLEEE